VDTRKNPPDELEETARKTELVTLERNETELEEQLNRRNSSRRGPGAKEHGKQ